MIVRIDQQIAVAIEAGCGAGVSPLLRDLHSLATHPTGGGFEAVEEIGWWASNCVSSRSSARRIAIISALRLWGSPVAMRNDVAMAESSGGKLSWLMLRPMPMTA